MTMLDPHPAANQGPLSLGIPEVLNPLNINGVSTLGQLSFNRFLAGSRPLAIGALLFQEAAQDPPVTIPGNVDEAEVYYQHTLARDVGGRYLGLAAERWLNLWGRPVSGAALNLDLTPLAPGISHTGVTKWYRENVLGDYRAAVRARGTSGSVGGSHQRGANVATLGRLGTSLHLAVRPWKLDSPVTLWLDDIAAGRGWEFATPGDQGEQNGMDLPTVLLHEVGHLFGREHAAEDLMAETLAASTRHVPGSNAYAANLTAAVASVNDLTEAAAWSDLANLWSRRGR